MRPFVVFGSRVFGRTAAALLTTLDFDVSVVEDAEARQTADALSDDPDAFWLVITRDHALDSDLIAALLPKRFAWLGMIGGRPKVARVLARLRAEGHPNAALERLSAPVGLDLGAQNPAEVAVAIAAEVIRVRRGVHRPPWPLSRPVGAE